jgi:phosphoribosylformylglycinamidine synthase II
LTTKATVPFADLDDAALRERISREGLRLTPDEARRVAALLGRNPTRTEAVLFDTLWSEHCSYKSSRGALKAFLPTEAPHVIIGPGEDAGVVYFTTFKGERWALVVGHESHNHPSQVVPFEGAATGIGGIVRDVYCMGADVIGVLDALRFGSLDGANAERSREIANGVVDGIWHYANALGVPNLGGDVAFHPGFDDNCLVNVVAVGIVRERDVVRSRVPAEAREEPYVFVLVGKPTDASGFGGASFASAVLDEAEAASNKGAVQVPDPFLKRVLTEANRSVFELARAEGFAVGFKDLGAGGIACATSELAAAGGFGAEIELSSAAQDGGPFPPEVVACSETQERYCWVVPQRWAQKVLQIYNVDFELPHLYPGARAQVIGRVRTEDTLYRAIHAGEEVCATTVETITEGIRYERAAGPAPAATPEPEPAMPDDLDEILAALLTGVDLASRAAIYRHYDTEVQGRALIRPGEADAGLLLPIEGCAVALAVSVDGNPFHGQLDPYQGGAGAVAESMRNVAAVGALPWCLTDCLNYGNPEDPEVFRQFLDGVRGVGDAAREIGIVNEEGVALPVVSGNVSFYNQSARGHGIPPSPIVACFGVLENYAHAVTSALKEEGNVLVLLGRRRRELGGSAYWRSRGIEGGSPPRIVFGEVRAEILALLQAVERGLVRAAHDISEGGLATAAAEMALSGGLGLKLELEDRPQGLRPDEFLFSETGGFLIETDEEHLETLLALCRDHGVDAQPVGSVRGNRKLEITCGGDSVIDLDLERLEARREAALGDLLR